MELWSGREKVITPRKQLTSVTEDKSERDTEESIADYGNEVRESTNSSPSVSSDTHILPCNMYLSGREMQLHIVCTYTKMYIYIHTYTCPEHTAAHIPNTSHIEQVGAMVLLGYCLERTIAHIPSLAVGYVRCR